MRKRLWEISQLAFLAWIVLLGEKSQVVSHLEQALEQFARFFLSVEQMPASDQPKGAWDKNTFTSRQSVHAAFLRPIAQDETIYSRSMASMVLRTRWSVAGRKPTSGIVIRLASSASEP
jgi:hypothetical protein